MLPKAEPPSGLGKRGRELGVVLCSCSVCDKVSLILASLLSRHVPGACSLIAARCSYCQLDRHIPDAPITNPNMRRVQHTPNTRLNRNRRRSPLPEMRRRRRVRNGRTTRSKQTRKRPRNRPQDLALKQLPRLLSATRYTRGSMDTRKAPSRRRRKPPKCDPKGARILSRVRKWGEDWRKKGGRGGVATIGGTPPRTQQRPMESN